MWFLSHAGFRKLRAETERHLMKGEKVRLLLYGDGGFNRYRMEVMVD